MTYVLAVLLTLLNALWLFLVVLGLPGTWLMVAGTLLIAWWRWYAVAGQPMFGTPVLIAICALAVLGEVVEFYAGVVGARKAGGTRRGALGALLGALVGGVAGTILIPIPIPGLGSLLGACGGAAVGAWGLELHSGREMRASVKSGVGAGAGRFAGTVGKLIIGVVIWVIVAVAAFWP